MGNASTKERSLTPPHGGHHHLSSTNLSSRRNNGGNNGGPSSSSGRLSSTILAGGVNGASESYSTRGRSRHNIENSLFGLGMNNGGRETRERDREAEREAKEQRKVEREKERLKERERSLREENVDGGFLVTQGVYTGVEDFKDKIVRHLMIERRLAPFFKGLDDYQSDWTDVQLIAAVKGLAIPPAVAAVAAGSPSPPRTPGPSDSSSNLTVPMASRSRAHSYTSEGSNRSATSTPSFGFSSRTRAKTLSISSPRNPTLATATGPAEINEPSRTVDGRPMEAVLYRNASECPICFLYYPPYLNKTRCCDQNICSECFVQIRRPDPHHPEHHEGQQPAPTDSALTGGADQLVSEPATCPFCVEPEFGIIYNPPPFRRGLMFTNTQSQHPLPSSPLNFGGFLDGTFPPVPSPYSSTPPSMPSSPTGKRRMALGVDNPEVVTTDRIRPDWAQKLSTARSHAARRAAAATALHTAAYLMGPQGVSPSNHPGSGSGGFPVRRLIRRTVRDGNGVENEIPSPIQSGTGTPRSDHHGGLTSLTSFTQHMGGSRDGSSLGIPSHNLRDNSLFNERRSRVIDLEEMMLMEAIRLSLAEEEDRKRREEIKEEKKRLATPAPNHVNTSDLSLASSAGSVEGKGKSVDRSSHHTPNNASSSSTTHSRPQVPSGGSGASDTSSFRSLPGSDDEGTPVENAGSGTETMFNFRSLAEMIVEEEGGRVNLDEHGGLLGLARGEDGLKEDAERVEHVSGKGVEHASGKGVEDKI